MNAARRHVATIPPPPLEPVEPPRPKRPASLWIILLIAWAVGLCVWLVYLLLFSIVIYRLM